MRRKNLMRLTAAMGMMMACSQVMQAAAPVWGNETVEETTAGSHDDLIEIPTLEDEEYPVDQGKQNYVDTIVQAGPPRSSASPQRPAGVLATMNWSKG